MRPLRSFPTTVKVVVVVLSVVGIALLFAQDQETLRVSSSFRAEDREFPTYVATLVGSELTSGNQYEVLTNGVRFLPAMLGAIRAAKRRISFETYIYGEGEVAEQFTTALADAARRGVEVRLLVDAVGAKDMEAEPQDRLLAIRHSLEQVTSKDFWEIIDRGRNFEYMPPAQREHLATFFAWHAPPNAPPSRRPASEG